MQGLPKGSGESKPEMLPEMIRNNLEKGGGGEAGFYLVLVVFLKHFSQLRCTLR